MLPVLLHSHLLPITPHAFTTRQGGISTGIFNSLNFGNPSDLPAPDRDPPANIRENFNRVVRAVNCSGRELVEVHQVHGSEVHIVHPNQPTHPTRHDTKADAIVTNDPTRILAVRIADCTPVLFSSQDGKIVGIAHAGWKGVISGVIPNTIRAMQSLGADRITAVIGPCIDTDHFEVGPDVADQFLQALGPTVLGATARGPRNPTSPPPEPPRSSAGHPTHPSILNPPKPHINLKHAIHLQLQSVGITQTDILPHCTYRDADLFFSHRREKGRTGRMAAVIGPRP